jgi:site-specific DNA recombinase
MLQSETGIIAGYVRRSSNMQKENFSLDAQKRAISDSLSPEERLLLVFFTDDESSARGEQIAKRPDFKKLQEEILAGRVQKVVVHSLDRWSRNVMVTLQSFRILADHQVAFVSLTEHIDYSTPEGRLQLTILAAFAAYFSDMLAKHTSKGKGERAAQGLHNGDTPFGYRRVGEKQPQAINPDTNPGLRMIGELRLCGVGSEEIADRVNAAGYRTGSKRFGQRLFNCDTINAILRNEFFAEYAPDSGYGTIIYKGQRYQGKHQATFTYEEWQRIREITQSLTILPNHTGAVRRTYDFTGYIICAQCATPLRSSGGQQGSKYYRDAAKQRRLISCPAGGNLQVHMDLVRCQFGDLLKELQLPEDWRTLVQRKMQEELAAAGVDQTTQRRERERLRLKKTRTMKLYQEGYMNEHDFRMTMASLELLLRDLESPRLNGVHLEDILKEGERLPDIAAFWDVATPQERREMVMCLLEPEGLHYHLERNCIIALRPRPVFQYLLRLVHGIEEKEGDSSLLLIQKNCQMIHEIPPAPSVAISQDDTANGCHPVLLLPGRRRQRRPGPAHPNYAIPREHWPDVLHRVDKGESYRQIAQTYQTSYQSVYRMVQKMRRLQEEGQA